MVQNVGLNQAQMDFLRLLSHFNTEEQVKELNDLVCQYYARKVDEEMYRRDRPHDIRSMKADGMPVEQIAKYTGLTANEINYNKNNPLTKALCLRSPSHIALMRCAA